MSHGRRHAKLSLLIAIIAVPVLALAVFLGLRAVPLQPLSQRPPQLEDDPREPHAEAEAAIAWRLMRMQDENGQIPDGAVMRAAAQMDAMRAAQASELRFSAASAISWTSIGPSNVGGRVRSIAIHPNDANTIFAGSAGGGIWKTTNGGASWSPVDDFMANLAVTSIVFVPTNPAVMYAATGEGLAGSRGIRGAGVFKSTDGGTTWNQLSSTANPNFYFVNRVAISPDGTTLLAATATGIYRSTDGGATFPAATLGGSIGAGISQVLFDPNNSSRAVAGSVQITTAPTPQNASVRYSTDGGVTWTPSNFGPSIPGLGVPNAVRVELAYAKGVPNKVYASAAIDRGRMYVSTDGGQSFTLASSGRPQFLGGQGSWANALWVDPTNDQRLVVGGVDLYRSTDGGSTLTVISGLIPGVSYTTHVDNHAIVSVPGYDGSTVKTVFLANDGGVYKAADITTATISSGWTDLNNGLAVTQFYSVATNVATGSIVGGTQDNATLRTSGSGTTWSGAHGSDGGFVAHDPVNTNYYYFGMLGLRIFRNETDGTGFGPEITGYWIDDSGRSQCQSGALGALCQDWIVGHANFNPPVVFDPNIHRLLVGADHLFVTTDPRTEVGRLNTPTAGGPSWFEIKPSTGEYISAVAVSPTSSNIIAVGHNDGAVYVTTDGTSASPTWAKRDDNTTGLPDRMVTSITFSAANPNTLWVTFGGYTSPNIWKSTNLGGTWSPIAGSGTTALPAAPIYDLKFLSTNENYLYLATEIGLLTSADGGAHWLPEQGPANVAVEQLAWLGPTTLVAATHGRGMFKATVGGSSTGVTVAGIVPASGWTAGGSAVTIIGANFVSGATVTIGGVAATNVTVVNATAITATTAAHAAGLVNVVVTNPDTQTGTLVNGFTYTELPLTLQAPANLIATVAGNSVTAAWTMPPSGIAATGFVVEGGVTPGSVLGSVPTGGTATTFNFNAPTGLFYIRVHALAGGTRSAASNEVRIAVNVPLPPAAPTSLVGEAFGSNLRLSWRNQLHEGTPTGIMLDVSGAFSMSMPLAVAENFTFSSVPPGTYLFSVRATNGSGASGGSNGVSLTFPAACVAASTPINFAATRSGNVISVSWNPAASGPTPTGYVLTVTGSISTTIPLTQTSISGGVGPGSYSISVSALHPCGSSAPTASQTVVIP